MSRHVHPCPRCGSSKNCEAPQCAENGTAGVPLVCESCAILGSRLTTANPEWVRKNFVREVPSR